MTAYVLLSGGIDSTVALALTCRQAEEVRAVGIDYGQRHRRELEHAHAIARGYDTPLLELPAPQPGATEGPVIHGRNLLLVATALTVTEPGDALVVGTHQGDHAGFPDCRPEFWQPLAQLILAAYGVDLRVPFIDLSKAEVIRIGVALGAPLAATWSCYEGGSAPCGSCEACVARLAALRDAGVE